MGRNAMRAAIAVLFLLGNISPAKLEITRRKILMN